MNEDTQTPEELAQERASQVPAVADFQDTPTASQAAQSEPVVDLGQANGQDFQPVDMNQFRGGLENAQSLLSDIQAQQESLRGEQEQVRQERDQTIQSEQEVNQLAQNRQNLVQRLTGAIQQQADIQRGRAEMEEAAEIPEISREVTEIQNKIDQRSNFYRRQKEQVQQSGISMAQAQARINDIERKEATELADLSIIENARLNRLDTAQALVDRKVQLAIEPLETEIQALKFQFNANEDLFTRSEQRLYQEQVNTRERERDQARVDAQMLEETKLQYLQRAQTNGASNELLESIMQANTPEEVIANAGEFGVSLEDRYRRAQISQIRESMRLRALEAGGEEGEVEEDTAQAEELLNLVNDIQNDPNRVLGVGARGAGFFGLKPTPGTDFKKKVERLKSNLTLENLELMSGVLSDSDIKILETAGTTLDTQMTEEAFEAELNRIRGVFRERAGVSENMIELDENGNVVIPNIEETDEEFWTQ